jgi:hypothetical protein
MYFHSETNVSDRENGRPKMATHTAAKASPKARGKKTSKKLRPKYDAKVGDSVERALHEMKNGALKSGGSGKTVTDPKQAIAIGISEAKRDGARAPEKP